METGAHLCVTLLHQPACLPIAQMPGYFILYCSVAPRGDSNFQSKLPASLSSTSDTWWLQQLHLDAVNVKCHWMAGCPSRKESQVARSQLRHSGKEVWHARAEDQTPHLSATASITAQRLPSFPQCWQQFPVQWEGRRMSTYQLLCNLSTRPSSNRLNKAVENLKVKIGGLYLFQIVSQIITHPWLADPA